MKSILAPALALLLLAPAAWAEEVADGDAGAERVGRLLLAADAAKRAEGEALLLARIAKGGDMTAFVRRMAVAARSWADDEHRLVDAWIRQAVSGDLEQRERAVRLITAMGEKAVMRLALELRHRVRHGANDSGEGPVAGANDEPQGTLDAAQPAQAAPQTAAVPHTPRVYDVTALKQKGLNPVQVVSFLRKEADASEVGSGPTRFVVYANATGHERLARKLDEIRVEIAAKQQEADKPKQLPKPAKTEDEPPAGSDDAPPPLADAKDGAEPSPSAPAPVAPNKAETADSDTAPRWTVKPIVVRVPRDPSLAKRMGAWKGMDVDLVSPFLAQAEQTQRKAAPTSATLVGTPEAVAGWFEKAPALPEARTAYGEQIHIAEGRKAQGFVGREVPYRRSVKQAKKSGAWRVVQDILHSGLELRFQLTTKDDTLRLRVDARLSEVSKPMATTKERPDDDAEPIELDVPEWNRQSRADTVEIPKAGGGLLMVMADPAKAEQGLVLILLRVQPAVEAQQMRQNANVNGLPSGERGSGN